MTIIVETEKRINRNMRTDFDVKDIDMVSESKAILTARDFKRADNISRILQWCLNMSRLDRSNTKASFKITQLNSFLKMRSEKFVIEGDVVQAFENLRGSYISQSTFDKIMQLIGDIRYKKLTTDLCA
jgi:hypothetical protein